MSTKISKVEMLFILFYYYVIKNNSIEATDEALHVSKC